MTLKVERTAASVVQDDNSAPLLNLNDAKQEDRNQNRVEERYGRMMVDGAQSNDQQKKRDEGYNPRRAQKASPLSSRVHYEHSICAVTQLQMRSWLM